MNTIVKSLNERYDDINIAYELLEDLQKQSYSDTSNEKLNKQRYIIASSIMLMIYNMIESIVSDILIKIYDEFSTINIQYDLLKDCIQKHIADNFKKSDGSFQDKILKLSTSGLFRGIYSLRGKKLDMGNKPTCINNNIDNEAIKRIMRELDIKREGEQISNLNEFEEIRMTRNKLTHGAKSFSDYGRYVRLDDLKKKKEAAYIFLDHLIFVTKDYLAQKKYLQDPIK